MNPRPEKYITPKEVQSLFDEQGISYHVKYWRLVIKQCPHSVKGGRYIRWSDVWSWWLLNPDYLPFSRKGRKVASGGAEMPAVQSAGL